MQNLTNNIVTKPLSSYISLSGKMTLIDALNFKGQLPELCHSGKDLYIDIKEVTQIDLNGLSALLLARYLTNRHGGELFVFVNPTNPLFALMTSIKFTNQLQFRDCIVSDSFISIAS